MAVLGVEVDEVHEDQSVRYGIHLREQPIHAVVIALRGECLADAALGEQVVILPIATTRRPAPVIRSSSVSPAGGSA